MRANATGARVNRLFSTWKNLAALLPVPRPKATGKIAIVRKPYAS